MVVVHGSPHVDWAGARARSSAVVVHGSPRVDWAGALVGTRHHLEDCDCPGASYGLAVDHHEDHPVASHVEGCLGGPSVRVQDCPVDPLGASSHDHGVDCQSDPSVHHEVDLGIRVVDFASDHASGDHLAAPSSAARSVLAVDYGYDLYVGHR